MNTPAKALPRRTKVGYGVAEIGTSSAEVMLQIYLLAFYTTTVGLSPALAGYALGLAVLWDAVTDPVMGGISDRTRSRWGRRRPYLLGGSLVLSAAFAALFWPPFLESQSGKFLYLLGCYIAVNTGMTLVSVPHSALGGEMSFDRHERTEIFGWRFLFRNLGFMLGAVLPGVLHVQLEETPVGGGSRQIAGVVVALAVLGATWITWHAVRRVDRPAAEPGEAHQKRRLAAELRGFFQGIIGVATNRVFAPLLLAYVVAQVGRTVNASLGLYFYTERLELTEQQFSAQVLGIFIVVIILSIGPWVLLSRRFGKKYPAFWGVMFLGVITTVSYPLMPPGAVWPPIVFASILGGATIGSVVLFESLVADIVDYDELRSGQHREGLYFGCWTMATKICRAVGLATTGVLLGAIGFEPGVPVQDDAVLWRLALFFGPGVGLCFLAAGLIFLWMPLDSATHARVQALLRQRQARRGGR